MLPKRKMTWRQAGTFPYYLSNNLTPQLYLKMLYYYASDADYQTCKRECGVKSKVWRLFVQKIRAILWLVVGQQQQQQLGGRDRIVAVDETFFTTKKRSRGGFRGRETAGHATLVLGMIELDLHTRRATGRCLLQVIPNRTKRTLKRLLTQRIVPGSLVFTDALKSYRWMSARDSPPRYVNHKKREFSRVERIFGGQEIIISSNAAEGLFGRLKSYIRQRGIKRVSKQCYGRVLAEFLWRQTCSARDEEPYSELLNEILTWQQRHPNAAQHNPSLVMSLPEEFRADFASIFEDEVPQGPQAPQPPQPPQAPQAPQPPQALQVPQPPQVPQLPQPAQAHAPPPAPVAHPAAPLAVEAPVAPAPAASHDELPPPGNDQARPRPDLGDSSDSDVEMLCFIPAPKRARARGVKQERPEHLHLPLQAPPRVKHEALYCRQGHALVFETPPPEVVLNEQQFAYFQTTCDVCQATVRDGTYRCQACDWDICDTCARANHRGVYGV